MKYMTDHLGRAKSRSLITPMGATRQVQLTRRAAVQIIVVRLFANFGAPLFGLLQSARRRFRRGNNARSYNPTSRATMFPSPSVSSPHGLFA